MSGSRGTGTAGREDFLAADRRTMAIAGTAMVALVLVGVVSSSLFAGPVCDRLSPRELSPEPTVHPDPSSVADGMDDARRRSYEAAVAALENRFGQATSALAVEGADHLADVAGGLAVMGDDIVVIDADGQQIRAAASFDGASVRGDGDVVYALALENEVTGQVDAVQPLDEDLQALTCVETATVGSPLAFYLDAADEQLLLLRADEAGEEPQLQLRDSVRGIVWEADVRLGRGTAGALGARTSAALGDAVVLGRHSSPGADAPVLVAFDRANGEVLWERHAEDLGRALAGAGERLVDVVEARGDDVVVVVRDEPEGAGAVDGPGDGPGDVQDTDAQVLTVSIDDGSVTDTRAVSTSGELDGPWRGMLGEVAQSAVEPTGDVEVVDVLSHPGGVSVLLDASGRLVVVTLQG